MLAGGWDLVSEPFQNASVEPKPAHRIIEPLASRCAKFRFRSLDDASMASRLRHVIEAENVDIEEKVGLPSILTGHKESNFPHTRQAIQVLMKISEGDLRKAITYLQSAFRLHAGDKITAESLFEIAGVVPDPALDTLLTSMWSNSFDKMVSAVNGAITAGYSVGQIVSQVCCLQISRCESRLTSNLVDLVTRLDYRGPETIDTAKSANHAASGSH